MNFANNFHLQRILYNDIMHQSSPLSKCFIDFEMVSYYFMTVIYSYAEI